jgi:hypothetical protein
MKSGFWQSFIRSRAAHPRHPLVSETKGPSFDGQLHRYNLGALQEQVIICIYEELVTQEFAPPQELILVRRVCTRSKWMQSLRDALHTCNRTQPSVSLRNSKWFLKRRLKIGDGYISTHFRALYHSL